MKRIGGAPGRAVVRGLTRGRRLWVLPLLVSAPVLAKDIPTTCQDICSTYTSTLCVVTAVKDIVVGSDVNCGTRDIRLDTGADLRVHDGSFRLRGKSLTLQNGGKMTADCPQGFENIGFTVIVHQYVTFVVDSGAKMSARCGTAGGSVRINAQGSTVGVAANGIDVSGTAADAPGGTVQIYAAGTVTIAASIVADATGGTAEGGSIEVRSGDDIVVYSEISAKGYGGSSLEAAGGDIVLAAKDGVQIVSGVGLNAETAAGEGGDVAIEAGGLADVQKPIRVQGTTGPSGMGGSIRISANEVKVDNDLIANGGRQGGTIHLEARSGGVSVGTGSQTTKVEATGDNGEPAGTITVKARGSAVTIGANARIKANGVGGGSTGGEVSLAGVDVTEASGGVVEANGASPNEGGVSVEARGALTLSGAVQANNSGSLIFAYRTGTPTIGGGISGYQLVQQSELSAPCGDGIRAGGESCDGADVGGATCASLGQGTGILGCQGNCAFDLSGCSGS